MRLEAGNKRKRPAAFLVLPPVLLEMPNNKSLKLFTKTWPLKKTKEPKVEELEPKLRPLTATLDKPTILDITFIGKIDMSKVRKEFLNISNLCRMPIILKSNTKQKLTRVNRPLSLPAPTAPKIGKKKAKLESHDDWEDQESTSVHLNNKKIKPLIAKTKNSDANNNKLNKQRKVIISAKPMVSIKQTASLPEPCKTCGRPDQPERFHSHPVTPLKPINVKNNNAIAKIPIVKSTVQKPVAIKYKSKIATAMKRQPNRKQSLPSQKLVHTPIKPEPKEEPRPTSSAKRTKTCYICGHEFGTASLPLHEPKCLQKFERENARLPPSLQKKLPVRPDSAISDDNWNKLAWEASQANLTPCTKCGRTFYPDRLVVHQRSCKSIINGSETKVEDVEKTEEAEKRSAGRRPKMCICYVCGGMFTLHSIEIHEVQCEKKWKAENEKLPANKQRPLPLKPDIRFTEDGIIDIPATNEENWKRHLSQLVPCKTCSRTFNPSRIEVHERSCRGPTN